MNRLPLGILLLTICATSLTAQDDVLDSRIPQSKQAMVVVDVNLESFLSHPLVGPMFNPRTLAGFGPPIDMKDYMNVKKVTVIVGVPDMRTGDAEFVTRVVVKDKTQLPQLVVKMFGFGREELDTRVEDGWTIAKSRRWPEVVRYRDDLLEFGTTFYTYTPTRTLVSKPMASAIESMDKESDLRIAFDSQVLSRFTDSVMEAESAREEAVYQMLQYGEFINEASVMLYGVSLLKEINTASLQVDLDGDDLAKLSIVPATGKEEAVKAKAKVLHDFLMFHVNLPVQFLTEKENPVAGILKKLADGLELSTSGVETVLTVKKPDKLSNDFLAIVDKMKVSFADRENGNKMKQLGLAIHNYHDTHRRMPQVPNPNDKGRFSEELSWRVKVLPFCEYYAEYETMDLTKGWDAKENQAVVGKCKDGFVLSNGALVCAITTDPPSTRFSSILDGTSNTIMLIENRNAAMTPWTKPFDLSIDDAVKMVSDLKKGESLWVAMYDGSVWKLPSLKDSGVTKTEIRNLFDPRDGIPTRTHEILQDSRPRMFPEVRRPRPARGFRDERVREEAKGAFKGIADDLGEAADEVVPDPPKLEEKRERKFK